MQDLVNTVSLLPIDVGFDLRLHDYIVDLSVHVGSDGMVTAQYLDRANRERLVRGPTEVVLKELHLAGYTTE